MHYLIVSEGGREYVLKSGRRKVLEEMARKLRAAKLFKYVRVDTRPPPHDPRQPPHRPGGQLSGESDSDNHSS
jgi:hypothetical protein